MALDYLTRLRGRAEIEQTNTPHDGHVASREMTDAERKATSDLIIKMGKVRRGEIELEPETISPAARAILEAGRRRRNEMED